MNDYDKELIFGTVLALVVLTFIAFMYGKACDTLHEKQKAYHDTCMVIKDDEIECSLYARKMMEL